MSMKTLASRIQYLGGDQISRMNKRKVESLRLAMKNSYNTRMIKVGSSAWPCLVNTMTGGRKANYEKDMISVEYAAGLEPGDTFEMLDTGVHWMVYLPVITETAYLKSEIIRCRYSLEINEKKYWVAVTGPQETDLRWLIKKNINANELNLSGVVYIKNDENTKKFFKRFTRIKLDGHTWEVQVTDSLTVPGIIELNIQEYYDNTIEELPEIKRDENNTELNVISGKTMVKQDTIVGYAINDLAYDPKAEWHVENNPRVEIEEVLEDGQETHSVVEQMLLLYDSMIEDERARNIKDVISLVNDKLYIRTSEMLNQIFEQLRYNNSSDIVPLKLKDFKKQAN